ncbi:MAG: NAD-glutamate dehydrogenase [Kiloniellales bacterium]
MGEQTPDKEAALKQAIVMGAMALLGGEQKTWVERLIAKLYAGVSPDDMDERGAEALAVAAVELLRTAETRTSKQPVIQVVSHGPDSPKDLAVHSTLRIINDDMPFLVDSVASELSALGVGISYVLHPIVTVRRDDEGKLVAIEDESCEKRESWMIVLMDRLTSTQREEEVITEVTGVLSEVRRAVIDWRPMLQRAESVALELARRSGGITEKSDRAAAEAASFLTWLIADHFTFLGFRAYTYEEGEGGTTYHQVHGSGLGLATEPGFRLFDQAQSGSTVPDEIRAFHDSHDQLLITKSDRPSRIHRRIPMDVLIIKTFDENDKIDGEIRFVGLLTSTAYHASPRNVPLLKGKVERIIDRAGLDPRSHDGKALLHILETYPRDELLQASEDELFSAVMGILALQDRAKTTLFLRRDPFDRYVTALVYTPREGYSGTLRNRLGDLLAKQLSSSVSNSTSYLPDDSRLARLHYILHRDVDAPEMPDIASLEALLAEAARSWNDRLRQALIADKGDLEGQRLFRRYGAGVSVSYSDRFPPVRAVADFSDFERLLGGEDLTVRLSYEKSADLFHMRAGRLDNPLPLSDLIPMIEHLGFRVLRDDGPYRMKVAVNDGERTIWLHDLALVAPEDAIPHKQLSPLFEEALTRLWWKAVEDDGLNALVTMAGLKVRDVALLRAYLKYLIQTGSMLSQTYAERALIGNGEMARLLVALFHNRFDPAVKSGRKKQSDEIAAALKAGLDEVASLDEDRILRRFWNAIVHTRRTNFFQPDAEGQVKSYISFKLDSTKLDGLPEPRPMVEVFVYSPRMEGIHLRGGKVARGGIRWSDRPEDFRTEILGLMKAQMVKNVVIVPVGSKGGFVVKQPPKGGTREEIQAEGIACYRLLMQGLLDITDNLVDGEVVPPKAVVRHDEDDPYLVVAADKGTATFSDIANGISQDYGFWLDDAFASGGSAGYDHKKMGITARGGWESVKRHFRELGHDTQTQPFTVVGVGDMSGDVFGNGMLLSDQIKLVAAFNHLHIFVDPDPDPAISFAERQRLFALPRSTWDDYDKSLISAGGGVFSRSVKSIALSAEMRAALGTDAEQLTPTELLTTILKAPTDLLWFGGIGTYVKAETESHADAGDRTNDAVRINAGQLRVKVVGEGANLGVTQLGRIEANLEGVKINTDALDNSAGVDCSDHEVNIKILLRDSIGRGNLAEADRNALLEEMTDEVAQLVLRDNYQQSQAISLAEVTAAQDLDAHSRLMRELERMGRLNRGVEYLPDGDEIVRRRRAGLGLTRPELYVILAYSKILLFDELVASSLPDDPLLAVELEHYFPEVLSERYSPSRDDHRLRREIIATAVVNSMINRVGSLFVARMQDRSGAKPADIARAYAVARDIFGFRETWAAIEALDNKVPADCQLSMLRATMSLLERATYWLLSHLPSPIDMAGSVERLRPAVVDMRSNLLASMPSERAASLSEEASVLTGHGVPEGLAGEIVSLKDLAFALDLSPLAERSKRSVGSLAALHFAVEEKMGFGRLHSLVAGLTSDDPWTARAGVALTSDLLSLQAEATSAVLNSADGEVDSDRMVENWLEKNSDGFAGVQSLLEEIKGQSDIGLAALVVLRRSLASLIE